MNTATPFVHTERGVGPVAEVPFAPNATVPGLQYRAPTAPLMTLCVRREAALQHHKMTPHQPYLIVAGCKRSDRKLPFRHTGQSRGTSCSRILEILPRKTGGYHSK